MKRSVLVFLILLFGVSFVLNSSIISVKAQDPLADYGDAPDPTYPSLYDTTSTAYLGRRGPYHLDVSQEWIGASPVSTTTVEWDALVPDGDFDDGAIWLGRTWLFGSLTDMAYVTVPVTISSNADHLIRYLNVVVDLDRNGNWSAYSVGGGVTQEEWIVPNYAIFTVPGYSINVNIPFDLVDPSVVPPYDNVWVRATLTTEYIDPAIFGSLGWDGSGPDGGFLRGETEDWLISVEDHVLFPVLTGFLAPPPGPQPPPPPKPRPDPQPQKGIEKEGVPDISQEPMECAPTSTANSLYYLAKECGFSDKLPGDPQNPRPLIEELKRKMAPDWEPPKKYPGVLPEDFQKGKEDITRQLGLPIETRCQNAYEGQIPTIEFIMRELDKCEDVELGMAFTDAKKGGHMVTVVGYTKYPDGSVRLKIHDPDDDLNGDVAYWVEQRGDYISLADYPRPNIVTLVCAESCIEEKCVGGTIILVDTPVYQPNLLTSPIILAISATITAMSVVMYKKKRRTRKTSHQTP